MAETSTSLSSCGLDISINSYQKEPNSDKLKDVIFFEDQPDFILTTRSFSHQQKKVSFTFSISWLLIFFFKLSKFIFWSTYIFLTPNWQSWGQEYTRCIFTLRGDPYQNSGWWGPWLPHIWLPFTILYKNGCVSSPRLSSTT